MVTVKMTPVFNSREFYHKTFGRDWTEWQLHAYETGKSLTKYVQHFIASNHKRSGGKGKLAKAIEFYPIADMGMAKIEWGIGHIPTLNKNNKYWYAVNYGKYMSGKKFIPGGGKYRPVEFADGSKADSSQRGRGTSRATKWVKIKGGVNPSPIRPLNFIEAGWKMLHIHITHLLARFKK